MASDAGPETSPVQLDPPGAVHDVHDVVLVDRTRRAAEVPRDVAAVELAEVEARAQEAPHVAVVAVLDVEVLEAHAFERAQEV